MRTVLYCRVSCDKQETDPQTVQASLKYPNAEVFKETASGVKDRPILEALTAELRDGDTLVVAALDRLGRRTVDVLNRLELLIDRGVRVESLREGPVAKGPTGRFLVSILASAAELERGMIVERTKRGLEAARAAGKTLGRPEAEIDSKAILALLREGVGIRGTAKRLDTSVSMIARRAKKLKEQGLL